MCYPVERPSRGESIAIIKAAGATPHAVAIALDRQEKATENGQDVDHSAVQYVGVESMLHMTCVGSSRDDISGYLDKAKRMGLRNILALRGDLPNIDEVSYI